MRFPTLVLLAMLFLTLTSSATSYTGSSPKAARVTAPAEIQGSVRSIRSERSGRRIVTRVTLELDEVAADGTTSVEIITPGGSVDGIRASVSGAPEFSVGEHVRVKVRATRSGVHLAGLADGKVLLP